MTEAKKWTDGERDEAFDRGMETMQRVALELYRRGREPLLAELEEARERNADLRTMLEQVTRDRDHIEESLVRLEAQRDEAIKARDQYLRERDQARLAEERARESLDELDEAIYECLPSDYDDDSPLDCVEHAADQLRALARERDEARAEVERLKREHDEMFAELRDLSKKYDECDAFKRGAEAMREACQQWCRAWENDGEAIADALADLSVPEEP